MFWRFHNILKHYKILKIIIMNKNRLNKTTLDFTQHWIQNHLMDLMNIKNISTFIIIYQLGYCSLHRVYPKNNLLISHILAFFLSHWDFIFYLNFWLYLFKINKITENLIIFCGSNIYKLSGFDDCWIPINKHNEV